MNEYLQAVVQANLLRVNGISDPEQIVTITRSEEIDDDKVTVVISLDVVTNVQDGVDELRCSITEEGYERNCMNYANAYVTSISLSHELCVHVLD